MNIIIISTYKTTEFIHRKFFIRPFCSKTAIFLRVQEKLWQQKSGGIRIPDKRISNRAHFKDKLIVEMTKMQLVTKRLQ